MDKLVKIVWGLPSNISENISYGEMYKETETHYWVAYEIKGNEKKMLSVPKGLVKQIDYLK